MKTLKKITLAELNNWKKGHLKGLCAASDDPVFVARILGSVRSQDVKSGNFGDSLVFKGSFQGYGVDGEKARAVVCYLPSPFDQMLSDQINEMQGDKPRLESPIEFGIDVFAVEDKCEAGYKFVIKTLLEAAEADPLATLAASLPALKLAAPTAAPALAAPETPAETPVEPEAKEPEAAPAAKAGKAK